MKAVIPVAGAGTRLRPHTYTQPKPLIPVAGKPIISFIIEQLVDLGVTDFVFVIGYLGEKIKLYIEKEYPKLSKVFVNQVKRQGSAHAIWTAREAIRGSEEIFIFFGDTIVDVDLRDFVASPTSCIGIHEVRDPREFGVVELNEEGRISKVIEKPSIPKSNKAMVGLYRIKEVDLLLDITGEMIQNGLKKQTHGEYQLTDALMGLIDKGVEISGIPVNNWFDCGKGEVLLKTNAMLLDKGGYASSNLPEYDNAIIIPPVSIGENCKISNSIVGPHVTIGNNTKINYSIVKDSIIGSYASIEEVVLQSSLVGSDAAIKGLRQSLNIGDNTEIDFS